MASQPGPSRSPTVTSSVEISSYVRGVHAYKDIWEPREGEVLLLKCEPDNVEDRFAVAVIKSEQIVGHVPKTLAPVVIKERGCKKGTVRITGKRVNRGGGFGLEAPCIFRLYGPDAYLARLKKLVDALEGPLVTWSRKSRRQDPSQIDSNVYYKFL